jgi:hypothetical protein
LTFSPPSSEDKEILLDLASDLFDSWYAGTPGASEEYFDSATRIWEWNDAEAGSDDDWDGRLGLSVLCAVLYRYRKPRNVAQRQLWKRLALETTDQWFTNQQDPVTGGIWRTDIANLVGDSGTVTFFGLAQVALIVRLLDVPDRWATQIADAVDYTTSRNELGYFTNGNIMFLKLVGYELAAYVTGDADRRQDVEDLWWFTVDPEAQQASVGNLDRWRGCGYIEDSAGVGYFSETTTTGNSIDHTGTNRLDWIYTDAQANYAGLGYVLFGDDRYLTYADACTRKMLERYDFETNQYSYLGGSRNAGPGVRNIVGPASFILGWLRGDATMEPECSGIINNETQGIDVDFRRYLTTTHSTFVRLFGLTLGASIIVAHGRVFS